MRRPKLPGNARPRAVEPTVAPQTVATCIRVEGFRVDSDGIHSSDSEWPEPKVKLDDLVKVGRLGSGKQGDVYKYCHKEDSEQKYALKIIRLPPGAEVENNSNIVAELKSALAHRVRNTVTLENAYVRGGVLVLIMEYMNYGNLRELIDEVHRWGLVLPEETVAWIASQILTALHDMNAAPETGTALGENERRRSHIHRDIKPENILLTRTGDVKLADFGVATSADSIGASTFVGTVNYMSPERITGSRHGPSSDLWSLGIVVAESILGRFPYDSAGSGFFQFIEEMKKKEVLLPPTYSAEAQSFLDKCLAIDADSRGTATSLLSHPWILKGLTRRDSFRQLIRNIASARSGGAHLQQVQRQLLQQQQQNLANAPQQQTQQGGEEASAAQMQKTE